VNRRPAAIAVLLSALVLPRCAAAADKSDELRMRLKAASELSALDAPGLQPWHWKIDLAIFDQDGKNPKNGELEMWSSGRNMLVRYSIGAEQLTVLRVSENLYTAGDLRTFGEALCINMQLLHPIPEAVFAAAVQEHLSTEKTGNIKVDWISPAVVKQRGGVEIVGRPFSFLLEPGATRLLMTYSPGDLKALRRQLGTFQAHEVPTDLVLYNGATQLSEARTVKLEISQPPESLFAVTPEMQPLSGPIELERSILPGLQLGSRAPVYPESAKLRQVTGEVVFNAVIGKDGRVVSLDPAGKFDPDLLKASQEAIQTWVYRPFLINGIPVEVKTQIHVNFRMG
jgi:hypothetical protein